MQRSLYLMADCVVCDAELRLALDLQASEVVSCPDCKSGLVVEKMNGKKVSLSKAPEVEEDWGE